MPLKVDFQFKGWSFAIIPGAVIRWQGNDPEHAILCSGYDEKFLEELFMDFVETEMTRILDERRRAVANKWLVRHFVGTFDRDDVQEILKKAYRKMNTFIEKTARQTENLDVIPGRKVEAPE